MSGLNHPGQRISGCLIILAIVFVIDLDNPAALHQLLLPLGLALGAYLVSQAFAAVCIAALALSLIHMNTASGEWISAIAYPAVAAIAALALIGISAQRFRARIAETHTARWQHRKAPH